MISSRPMWLMLFMILTLHSSCLHFKIRDHSFFSFFKFISFTNQFSKLLLLAGRWHTNSMMAWKLQIKSEQKGSAPPLLVWSCCLMFSKSFCFGPCLENPFTHPCWPEIPYHERRFFFWQDGIGGGWAWRKQQEGTTEKNIWKAIRSPVKMKEESA